MTTSPEPLRLGTRRSRLAMAQAQTVADALTASSGRAVQLVEVTTLGDVSQAALTQIGGTGVFVGALRDALLRGSVDLAVHSLKDLPTAPAPGLVVAAIPTREDPRDALCARDGLTIGELPVGARIGTGSPRRAAMVQALGFGLDVVAVRGNVDTRLRLVADGELDAVLLARAGLARLGRLDAVSEILQPNQMLPAPGQGALAIECRSDDDDVLALLTPLDDVLSRAAVTAERALLAALEAGCSAPVGALAEIGEGDDGVEIYLQGAIGLADGQVLRLSATGPLIDPAGVAQRLAGELLDIGGPELNQFLAASAAPPVLISTPTGERAPW